MDLSAMRDSRRRMSISSGVLIWRSRASNACAAVNCRVGQQLAQLGEVAGGQIVELDADARLGETMLAQQVGEHGHGVELELAPDRDLGSRRRLRPDGIRLHVDDGERDRAVGSHQRHGVAPAHDRLRSATGSR